ncbi:MAG: hypothetical protein ACOYOJ_13355 [Alsobacter sp.]
MINRPKDDPAFTCRAVDTVTADEGLARIRLGLIALSDVALTEPLSLPMRLLLRRLDEAERVNQNPPPVSDGD